MRTFRLFGLTVAVVAAHLLAWQVAVGGLPRVAPERAGVRRVALVHVPLRATGSAGPAAPAESPEAAPPPRAPPSIRPSPRPSPRPPSPRPPPAPEAVRSRADSRPAPSTPPRPGEHGPARQDTPPAPPWPVYATRAPPSTTLGYVSVQAGGSAAPAAAEVAGRATLEWVSTPSSFTLRLRTQAPGRAPREWVSEGGFDVAGLAPERAVERERGRDRRTINFDRAGRRVRFSGAAGAPTIAPGAQDRWSWIAQLAAIAAAASTPGAPPVRAGTRWELQVAGPRGELDRWSFLVQPDAAPPPGMPQGSAVLERAFRAPALLHVRREPERPYDLRIEAWLSPALHFLPAGLRMSAPPGPWSLSQWLAEVDTASPEPEPATRAAAGPLPGGP